MDQGGDLFYVSFKEAQGVRIREHEAGTVGRHERCQVFEVHAAGIVATHRDRLVAAQGSRGRVCAMGRIGNQDPGSPLPLFRKIFFDDHDPRQLPVSAGGGLQGKVGHAEDFRQVALQRIEEPQRPLGKRSRGMGMKPGKAGKPCHVFVDFGVVLHRAGAERIKPQVHAEVAPGQGGIMAHQIHFRHLGEIEVLPEQIRVDEVGKGGLRDIAGRQLCGPAAGAALFKD